MPVSPLCSLVARGPLYHLLRRATLADPRASIHQRGEERLGKQGLRVEFATVPELMHRVRELTSLTTALEQRLLRSIALDSVSRLEADVHDLITRGIEQRSSVHIEVLKNLVQKLLAKNNHKYAQVVRMVSRLYKPPLRQHSLLGARLPFWPSKREQHQAKIRAGCRALHLGENAEVWDRAAKLYRDEQGRPLPVINCGDGVRITMKVSAVTDQGGEVELVGECWSADRTTWGAATVRVPKPQDGQDGIRGVGAICAGSQCWQVSDQGCSNVSMLLADLQTTRILLATPCTVLALVIDIKASAMCRPLPFKVVGTCQIWRGDVQGLPQLRTPFLLVHIREAWTSWS